MSPGQVAWLVFRTATALAPATSTVYTNHHRRRTAAAQERAAKASCAASEETVRAHEASSRSRNGFGDDITSRTFEIPSNSFNAGPEFTAIFAVTAIIGVALVAKAVEELKKIGIHLEGIKDELGAQTTAMVQGWQTRGFGAFIYEFLKTEIDDYGGDASVGNHAFYVYNPTSSADVVFKQMVRDRPLPASFGGFSSDLETIFLLMWRSRQTLRETRPKEVADHIVFHLLVPAKRPMAIIERLAIDEGVGKLIIKGHKDEGNCSTWFNFIKIPHQVLLKDIGNLDTDLAEEQHSFKRFSQSVQTGIACWLGAATSTIVFPPAGPIFVGGFILS